MTMGPTRTGIGPRGGARQGWGMTIPSGSNVVTVREFRRRVKALQRGVREKAREMLYAAAEPLRDQWRDNIAAEGWAPGGGVGGAMEGIVALMGGEPGASTGRYYNSIVIEVRDDLTVEVGSNIPRPSGRGLHTWSYPEALEFGTSVAQAYPTMRPAYDTAGPKMEARAKQIFDATVQMYMLGYVAR